MVNDKDIKSNDSATSTFTSETDSQSVKQSTNIITFQVEKQQSETLKKLANNEGRSVSNYLRNLLKIESEKNKLPW